MDKNHSTHTRSGHLLHFFKAWPLFLILLPAFFVLHGFAANYDAVPVTDALFLFFLYACSALVIAALGWFYYRDMTKACLLAFMVMAWQFFFGTIQDGLKGRSPAFLSQYRFLLPFGLLLFLALAIWLKKRTKTFPVLTPYLNILLLLLILLDGGRLVSRMTKPGKYPLLNPGTATFTLCDSCSKPDIYLIVLDQYAGSTALKEVFNFDNTAFERELDRRQFHIVRESRSNYNLTPFSIASLLNMDYLESSTVVKNRLDVGYSYRLIRNSFVVKFLKTQGYSFYNHSIFDFPGQPAHEYGAFLPYGTKMISSPTFTGRLRRDIRSGILEGKFPFKAAREKIAYEYLHFNDDIFKLTSDLAAKQSTCPKFIYAHLMIPHYPYYFDSKGSPLPMEKLSGFRHTNANDYIEYLQYGNQKILELVDHILSASPCPPVIMLLADHGFRHPEKETALKYDFLILNAVYVPGQEYSRFYEGMSLVNQFRVFFNSRFKQQFPLLKDSTIDLWD